MPDAPPITVRWVQTNASDGGPRGSKGVAEAPNVATAAAIANALSKLTGGPLRKLPMTPERVWEHTQEMGSGATPQLTRWTRRSRPGRPEHGPAQAAPAPAPPHAR